MIYIAWLIFIASIVYIAWTEWTEDMSIEDWGSNWRKAQKYKNKNR